MKLIVVLVLLVAVKADDACYGHSNQAGVEVGGTATKLLDNAPASCKANLDCLCEGSATFKHGMFASTEYSCGGLIGDYLFSEGGGCGRSPRPSTCEFDCSAGFGSSKKINLTNAKTCQDIQSVWKGVYPMCCSDFKAFTWNKTSDIMRDKVMGKSQACAPAPPANMDCMCEAGDTWDNEKEAGDIGCVGIMAIHLGGVSGPFQVKKGGVIGTKDRRATDLPCPSGGVKIDTSTAKTCQDLKTAFGGSYRADFCCKKGSKYAEKDAGVAFPPKCAVKVSCIKDLINTCGFTFDPSKEDGWDFGNGCKNNATCAKCTDACGKKVDASKTNTDCTKDDAFKLIQHVCNPVVRPPTTAGVSPTTAGVSPTTAVSPTTSEPVSAGQYNHPTLLLVFVMVFSLLCLMGL